MDNFFLHPWESLVWRLTDAAMIPGVWFGTLFELCSTHRILLVTIALLLSIGLYLGKLRSAGIALACITLTLTCIPTNFGKFEKQVWLAHPFQSLSTNDDRYWMADNLINSGLLLGNSHVEVQHILGEPDYYGRYLMGEAPKWCYVLRLQPHAYATSLYVRFDKHGRVQAVEKGEYFSAKDDSVHGSG